MDVRTWIVVIPAHRKAGVIFFDRVDNFLKQLIVSGHKTPPLPLVSLYHSPHLATRFTMVNYSSRHRLVFLSPCFSLPLFLSSLDLKKLANLFLHKMKTVKKTAFYGKKMPITSVFEIKCSEKL